MANDISGNPWSLDTAGVVATFPVYCKNIVWQGGTAGDTLAIVDNQGREIINTIYNSTDDVMDFGAFQWVQGFNIVTIDSGVVTVVVHK